MVELKTVRLLPNQGLEGDRFKGRIGSARQVTLIQKEHLDVIAACLHRESLSPAAMSLGSYRISLRHQNGSSSARCPYSTAHEQVAWRLAVAWRSHGGLLQSGRLLGGAQNGSKWFGGSSRLVAMEFMIVAPTRLISRTYASTVGWKLGECEGHGLWPKWFRSPGRFASGDSE